MSETSDRFALITIKTVQKIAKRYGLDEEECLEITQKIIKEETTCLNQTP